MKVVKKIKFSLGFCFFLVPFLAMAGCSGSADNTVSAPPETAQTQEELNTQMKDYETRMRDEEAQRAASN